MTITRYAFTTRMGVGAFQYEALPVVVPDGPYVLHTDHLADKAEAVRGLRRILLDLLHTPAVLDALNPSGLPHLNKCGCSFCLGLAALAEHGV